MYAEVKYVGFWPRVLASLIDTVWLYGLIYGVLWFLTEAGVFEVDSSFSVTRFTFEWIIPVIIVMAFWIKKSATPGKLILKMKIVDAQTHEKVPGARLFLRYLGYFVSVIPLGLGLLWVAWDKKKQGWHDKIAKTVLIYDKES